MEKNYSKHWFSFVEKGHIVRKSPVKRISFTIEGVDFKLVWSEPKPVDDTGRMTDEWFRLYQVEKTRNGYIETMYGSDFYNLGRNDIHIMADDGIRHLETTLATQDE